MQRLDDILHLARNNGYSDVHLGGENHIMMRNNGILFPYEHSYTTEDVVEMILSMLDENQKERLNAGKDIDLVYVENINRYRVNVYKERGQLCAALRVIYERIRSLEELQLPPILNKLTKDNRGLVLLTGPTGSGKSTLVNLIPRFYDVSEGEVDIAGKNIQDYTYGSLRNTISVVPQKAQLFAGTIRDNLTFGCPDATEEQIEEALDISQAKEFVDTKEGRLDAKIEQGGKNLSGGQRQRLTLARALVPQSDILIMDDSASALDYATDARLRKAIQDMKRKPTVFIVSQRTSSIQNADMILVLDDGKIAGQGTHEQLLKSCNIYREIYETQFKKEEA